MVYEPPPLETNVAAEPLSFSSVTVLAASARRSRPSTVQPRPNSLAMRLKTSWVPVKVRYDLWLPCVSVSFSSQLCVPEARLARFTGSKNRWASPACRPLVLKWTGKLVTPPSVSSALIESGIALSWGCTVSTVTMPIAPAVRLSYSSRRPETRWYDAKSAPVC